MSIAAIDQQPALPVPSRIGQGTAVEQSRAIAEVQAAVVVAQQVPRSITRAERDMRRSCAQKSLAEKAFYRFPRGRETVSGASVQLARELARCFGNVQYGVTELRRDDGYGQSEMQAWAWDLETNTRSSTTFIVPHRRDKRGGPEALTEMRDIYENNANNGARRLREMIFAILPGWYTEDAIAACYETLAADNENGSRDQRIRDCIDSFSKLGIRQTQLEEKTGGPVAKWTPYDIAQLQVIYRSLMRGETSKEQEFGATGGAVTAADIAAPAEAEPAQPAQQRRRGRAAAPDASPAAPQSRAAETTPETPPPGPAAGEARTAMATGGQVGMIQTEFERLGYDLTSADDERAVLRRAARLAGAGEITALNQLPQEGARQALDVLKKVSDVVELDELLESGTAPDA